MKGIIKKILDYFGYDILRKGTLQKYKDRIDPYKIQKDLVGHKKDLCIFDVGAHYGETAVKYKAVFPDAKIYSFEPFPEAAKAFSLRTGAYSSIKLFELAFSSKTGESEFNVNSSDATNSLLNSAQTNSWVDDAIKHDYAITVNTDTIDNFCERQKVNIIDILKLDVQGAELLVLEGAANMLASNRIKMIFSEVEFIEVYKNQPLFHDVTVFLEKYDYKLFGLYDTHLLENGQIAWCDAVYLKAI
jgi:FkbM family methyltransferase